MCVLPYYTYLQAKTIISTEYILCKQESKHSSYKLPTWIYDLLFWSPNMNCWKLLSSVLRLLYNEKIRNFIVFGFVNNPKNQTGHHEYRALNYSMLILTWNSWTHYMNYKLGVTCVNQLTWVIYYIVVKRYFNTYFTIQQSVLHILDCHVNVIVLYNDTHRSSNQWLYLLQHTPLLLYCHPWWNCWHW